MSDLIARLEAATEGSEEIDAMIWWRVEPRSAKCAYWNASTGLPRELADTMPTSGLGYLALKCHAPKYSRSLDDAMTLVPEGAFAELHISPKGTSCDAEVNLNNGKFLIADDTVKTSTAATAPLALVSAALKALEIVNE